MWYVLEWYGNSQVIIAVHLQDIYRFTPDVCTFCQFLHRSMFEMSDTSRAAYWNSLKKVSKFRFQFQSYLCPWVWLILCQRWCGNGLALIKGKAITRNNDNTVRWDIWERHQASIGSSPPGQNGRGVADDIFECIFIYEKFSNSIQILLKSVPKSPIDNSLALV